MKEEEEDHDNNEEEVLFEKEKLGIRNLEGKRVRLACAHALKSRLAYIVAG